MTILPADNLYTESDLLFRISKGDEKAFLHFFNEKADGVFAIVFRIIKDKEASRDLVQETFIAAWQHRESLAVMEKPTSWLLKTATNFSLKYLRRKKLEEKWAQHTLHTQKDSNHPLPEENTRELHKWIALAVDALPPQRKKIYELSKQEGLSRREIAEKLGISENTVKNQLAEGLKNVQAFLISKGISLSLILGISIYFLVE